MPKPSRYFPTRMPTQTKPAPIGIDLLLKIGTALLISFAATSFFFMRESFLLRR